MAHDLHPQKARILAMVVLACPAADLLPLVVRFTTSLGRCWGGEKSADKVGA
jgi:hypothetical protein